MRDLCRLARFGANITDAHSCFILLPEHIGSNAATAGPEHCLQLFGYHSLSTEVVAEARVPKESGLVGWVAAHQRSIHVSPFERDSRTLGLYTADQGLKSFIGIPVALSDNADQIGVVACDSKKSFAFSKLQGKLLEDLGREVSNTVQLILRVHDPMNNWLSWELFELRCEELARELGRSSVEFMRVRHTNFDELEAELGVSACLKMNERFQRLVAQALPPQTPMTLFPNGDIMIALDNMMSKLYEGRIEALASHLTTEGPPLKLEIMFSGYRAARSASNRKVMRLGELSRKNNKSPHLQEPLAYEYRRA